MSNFYIFTEFKKYLGEYNSDVGFGFQFFFSLRAMTQQIED